MHIGGSTEVSMVSEPVNNSARRYDYQVERKSKTVNRKQSFRHKLGALHSMTAVRRIVVKSKTGQLQALSWQLGISLGHNIV